MKRAVVATLILFTSIVCAAAQQTPADRAKVIDAYGQTQKRVSRTPDRWLPVAAGDLLPPDSAVRTADRSAILLQTPDRHSIRVGASTTLELKDVGKDKSYTFQLIAGEIWSFVNKARKPAKFEVDTPTAVLGVRGTIFHVAHDVGTNESEVSVNEGTVNVNQAGASQTVQNGYQMRVRPNQLRQARPARLSPGNQQMWKVVLREKWAEANANAKLDRDADGELQRVRQQQRAEDARQNQQAEQKTAREKAKQEAIEKARAAKAAKAGKAPKARKAQREGKQ